MCVVIEACICGERFEERRSTMPGKSTIDNHPPSWLEACRRHGVRGTCKPRWGLNRNESGAVPKINRCCALWNMQDGGVAYTATEIATITGDPAVSIFCVPSNATLVIQCTQCNQYALDSEETVLVAVSRSGTFQRKSTVPLTQCAPGLEFFTGLLHSCEGACASAVPVANAQTIC